MTIGLAVALQVVKATGNQALPHWLKFIADLC